MAPWLREFIYVKHCGQQPYFVQFNMLQLHRLEGQAILFYTGSGCSATPDHRDDCGGKKSDASSFQDCALGKAGKAPKVALVACMRKLLTILEAMIKHKTHWCVNTVQIT